MDTMITNSTHNANAHQYVSHTCTHVCMHGYTCTIHTLHRHIHSCMHAQYTLNIHLHVCTHTHTYTFNDISKLKVITYTSWEYVLHIVHYEGFTSLILPCMDECIQSSTVNVQNSR